MNPADIIYWEITTITDELMRLLNLSTDGVHYVGKTSSRLYEGSTLNSIVLSNNSTITPKSGDLVILIPVDKSSLPATTTLHSGEYVTVSNVVYYIINDVAVNSPSDGATWVT